MSNWLQVVDSVSAEYFFFVCNFGMVVTPVQHNMWRSGLTWLPREGILDLYTIIAWDAATEAATHVHRMLLPLCFSYKYKKKNYINQEIKCSSKYRVGKPRHTLLIDAFVIILLLSFEESEIKNHFHVNFISQLRSVVINKNVMSKNVNQYNVILPSTSPSMALESSTLNQPLTVCEMIFSRSSFERLLFSLCFSNLIDDLGTAAASTTVEKYINCNYEHLMKYRNEKKINYKFSPRWRSKDCKGRKRK